MDDLTADQLEYVLQFQHPEKRLGFLPGVKDETIAPLFDMDAAAYRAIRDKLDGRARGAARELLADAAVAAQVDALPFEPGQTVVGLADSITDDDQSWFTILRHLVNTRRGEDGIRFVNAGISGDCTTQLIARFLEVVLAEPDWIVCMVGTNDCRRHGERPTKPLVSLDETAKNLDMLRNYSATQTCARWVAMTPSPVIEETIAAHWFLGPMQLAWHNRDLKAVADLVRERPEPCVDLWSAFGDPPDADLLLDDGLHPSLAGQVAIARALLDVMSNDGV